MKTKQYLQRINYTGALLPNLETLKKLQKAHILHIPFENLDIHNNTKIKLDTERIFQKVILNNRGGFCYELNGLFHELLQTLGFQVSRISARVYAPKKGYGMEFDHLVNLVHIDGQEYLSDVGFGEFTFYPLKLELHTLQTDERGVFRLDQHDEQYLRVSKKAGDQENKWIPEYIFSTKPRAYQDYAQMCQYHQKSPDSHFTQKPMCTLAKENGRITISRDNFKVTEQGNQTEQAINSEEEFHYLLLKHFNIKLHS